jgi:midasin (ATPase involved in ribosome maturation)
MFQRLNIVYSQSRFSVCLVGKTNKRDKMVNGIATIYGKRVVKIILSTMTDMNDLLGSYEQISEED